MMNWLDYTVLGIIVFSAVISIVRGFVREVLSLISWITAFFISSYFYPYLTDYLTYFSDGLIRNAVAITILFIVTLIVCTIVSYVISLIITKTGLTGLDRLLGIFFGVLRGILVVAAMLFFVRTFTPLPRSEIWRDSQLIPHFNYIIHWFFNYLQSTSAFLI